MDLHEDRFSEHLVGGAGVVTPARKNALDARRKARHVDFDAVYFHARLTGA
jgi:hypothetical protein